MNGSFNSSQNPPNYAIEYGDKTIKLGDNWSDICKKINEEILDKRVGASLKLVLFERLKGLLSLGAEQLEPLMQEYSDIL